MNKIETNGVSKRPFEGLIPVNKMNAVPILAQRFCAVAE